MRLDHAWIARHIPHAGAMCLLDGVVSWSAERILCTSSTHRSRDNPLRACGGLGIACGIEYAAQAMAVHGALAGGALAGAGGAGAGGAGAESAGAESAGAAAARAPAAGFLVGLRDVEFHALTLHDVAGDLDCEALRVAGDPSTALYHFEIRSGAKRLLAGRATVLLRAGRDSP